ncbi:uncharacterized protein LOC143284354 [Babylonia areolata]|uniref:uncharacterized protein LOC143284354 n=1 Tax=Babylonia areolata TaxID=304850 RepID=UPI003FD29E4E
MGQERLLKYLRQATEDSATTWDNTGAEQDTTRGQRTSTPAPGWTLMVPAPRMPLPGDRTPTPAPGWTLVMPAPRMPLPVGSRQMEPLTPTEGQRSSTRAPPLPVGSRQIEPPTGICDVNKHAAGLQEASEKAKLTLPYLLSLSCLSQCNK